MNQKQQIYVKNLENAIEELREVGQALETENLELKEKLKVKEMQLQKTQSFQTEMRELKAFKEQSLASITSQLDQLCSSIVKKSQTQENVVPDCSSQEALHQKLLEQSTTIDEQRMALEASDRQISYLKSLIDQFSERNSDAISSFSETVKRLVEESQEGRAQKRVLELDAKLVDLQTEYQLAQEKLKIREVEFSLLEIELRELKCLN